MKPHFASCALIVASLAMSATPARAGACLNRAEMEGLITFSLPVVVDRLSTQCRPTLPATAPLIQSGRLIAAKYQVEADVAWPDARKAFDKMSGVPLSGLLGQEAMRALVRSAISDDIARDVKPEDCGIIDRVVDVLQPLPTRNMAVLLSSLVELGDRKKVTPRQFKLCPPEIAK